MGYEGKKCEVASELIFNLPSRFVAGALDNAEIKVNPFWGAITTDVNGGAVTLPEGSHCVITLKAQGAVSDVYMGQISFYDEKGQPVDVLINTVSSNTRIIRNTFWEFELTKQLSMIRISMYDPFISISRETFDECLNSGELELRITVYNPEDVVLEK